VKTNQIDFRSCRQPKQYLLKSLLSAAILAYLPEKCQNKRPRQVIHSVNLENSHFEDSAVDPGAEAISSFFNVIALLRSQ
jgi:hypothetical protein